MTEKPDEGIIVYCNCGAKHHVGETATSYRCSECGTYHAIARPVGYPDSRWSDVQRQLADLKQKLENRKPASPDEKGEWEALLRRIDDVLSEMHNGPSGITSVEILPIKQHFVPLERVNIINEADLEAGIALGVLTLFLGVFIQEWVNRGAINATVVALFLPTLISGFAAVYFYYKRHQRKRQLDKDVLELSREMPAAWLRPLDSKPGA